MPLSGPGVGTAHRSCHSFDKRICDARNCLIRVCENELQRTVPCTRGDYCRLSRLVLRAICVGRGLTLTLMASAVYACPIPPHAMEQSLCKSWPACGRFWRGTIISRAVTFRSLCSRSVPVRLRRLDRLLRQRRGFRVQPDCSIRQFLSVIYGIGALVGTLLLFV